MALEANLQSTVSRLKSTSDVMDAAAVASLVDALWLRVDAQLASVKGAVDNEMRMKKKKQEEEEQRRRKEAEEKEKIRRVEEEMEKQKKKGEAEERKRREEEEEKRQRTELEVKRIEEVAVASAAAKSAEEPKAVLVKSQVDIERRLMLEAKEEVLKMQRLEQERRDHELALRLARDEEDVDDTMITAAGGLRRGSQASDS